MLLGLIGGHRGGSVSPEKDPPVLWVEAGLVLVRAGEWAGGSRCMGEPLTFGLVPHPTSLGLLSPAWGLSTGSCLGDGGVVA